MKTISILILVAIHFNCKAQEYYCPVSASMGYTNKIDQWITIGETEVKTKTIFKAKTDSLSYDRRPASNPAIVYFTDGVTTTSLTLTEQPGTIKGIKYTHMITLKSEGSQSVGVFYCTKIRE